MKTVSISISTLCVPCANRCRYCLLSWDGRPRGADYERSRKYAEGFYYWLKENQPEIAFQFYHGYAMEHPKLTEAIDFCRQIGSAGGEFLQLDGLEFRSEEGIRDYLFAVQAHGIRAIDLTFYGTEKYHDRFAGRRGDFAYMMQILHRAIHTGIKVHISIPLTNENAGQMEELMDIFEPLPLESLRIFVPHSEGRGANLENIRLTGPVLDGLSCRVRSHINLTRYKTEGRWLADKDFKPTEKRMLGICLTPNNIELFERMSYESAISYMEKLDDDYYAVAPALEKLAAELGNPTGEKVYDQRDLYLYYQKRYIRENGLQIYDINDERQCFVRRY